MTYGTKLTIHAELSDGTVFRATLTADTSDLLELHGNGVYADAALAGLSEALEHDGWFGQTCPGCGDARIDYADELCASCAADPDDEE